MNTNKGATRTATLPECCEIVSGSTPSRAQPEYWGGDIPWVTPRDLSSLEGNVLHTTDESITKAGYESCSTRLLPAGTVLFSSRAPIGLVAIAGQPMCTNQGFKSLIPGPDLDSGYLFWTMKRAAKSIEQMGNGTTFTEVSKEAMSRVRISIPPLAEQRRIAELLNRADAVQRKREESLRLVDELLLACYMDIVGSGCPGHSGWPLHRISELAAPRPGALRTGPFGSSLRHSEFEESGIAVLGIDNVVKNRFAWEELRFISERKYRELKQFTVFAGDVLITIMGTLGRSAVAPTDLPSAISTKHLAVITVDESKVSPEFLSYAIAHDPVIRSQIGASGHGSIMSGLNLGLIRRLEIRLPHLSLQHRFRDQWNAIRSLGDAFERGTGNMSILGRTLSNRSLNTPLRGGRS